jgi:hypothetical protein
MAATDILSDKTIRAANMGAVQGHHLKLPTPGISKIATTRKNL